jgi:phage tail sheath gpL-like
MTRSVVLAVRETTPFAITASPAEITLKQGDPISLVVTAKRRGDMPNAIQLNGAGMELPPGLTIPTTTINAGQTEGKLTLATDKMKEGTYSFIVNSEGQVPNSDKNADKKNIRVIYPSNPIKVTIEPKSSKKDKLTLSQ